MLGAPGLYSYRITPGHSKCTIRLWHSRVNTAGAACIPPLAFPFPTEEDFKDAQDAVAHAAEAWNNLLASVASQLETAAELRRSTGQKMKQLDEELRVMTDALIHVD